MNSRGQIGQALTSFPSLIFVFVIMFLFVTIAVFIADSRDYEENMATDFAGKTIALNGSPITVKEAIEKGCKSGKGYVLDNAVREAIINRFIELYGGEYSFVLATYAYGIPLIGEGWILKAGYGVFKKEIDEKLGKVSIEDFNKLFNPETKNYDAVGFCDPIELNLFIKKGAEL